MIKSQATFTRRVPLKTNIAVGVVIVLLTVFYFLLPSPLFHQPVSIVLQDDGGNLLGAAIASDGQWRFPYDDQVTDKFRQCIITFEDKRFYYHPGIDAIALTRATWKNLRSRKVVSGGSTITMQVARLSRGKNRNLWQKLVECLLAVRLECAYSKNEILALYASNAPFGSNVVGLSTASWRYFGRSADKLSWGETAALAVLPNSPSLVHPGKNRNFLLKKRNRLLQKLVSAHIISQSECYLAQLEPLPGKPLPLPQLAPHLLNRFAHDRKIAAANSDDVRPSIISTTIQSALQIQVTQLVERHHRRLKGNGINNAAAMVMDIETGNVLAYVGNVYHPGNAELESHVDVLAAPRSPGSTLKPLLYAAMQSDGLLLPRQLVADIPTQISGYTPQNFNLEYDGAVPANRALSRSLNVPAVKMLQQYKYQRFYEVLQQCGFTTIKKPADFYGLSLILGGCEVTPWELAGVYSSLARSYLHQQANSGKFAAADWHVPVYEKAQGGTQNAERKTQNAERGGQNAEGGGQQVGGSAKLMGRETKGADEGSSSLVALPFDFTAIWHTFNAMQEVMRPGEEGLWNLFNAAQRIGWKTGTSFGFRDGWAIGITPRYCVLVWVGNTDGEGRPELTGINTAAPIMFDIFRMLPPSPWFKPPAFDFNYLPVCHQTGFKAAPDCTDVDTMLVSINGKKAPLCPYHRIVHLDRTGQYRVTESCENPSAMVHKSWFTLPPAMEYYYKARHTGYQPLPPYLPGCAVEGSRQMEMIYPDDNARIHIPIEVTGEQGRTVFTAAHRNPNAQLFWHLDDVYIGTTIRFHQMAINPARGQHVITIVDEFGETIRRRFEILEKEGK